MLARFHNMKLYFSARKAQTTSMGDFGKDGATAREVGVGACGRTPSRRGTRD